MIPFNIPPFLGIEFEYVRQAAVVNHKICGDGPFTKKCHEWLENRFHAKKALLTTSGTAALEMAAMLCQLSPGDEVIMPSFTFSSTATAFVQFGARIVFVDVRPDTMNIDETKIEDAITDKTKVIVVVHYAGVACEMDAIMDIAERHGLFVVEDAAQAVMSAYKGTPLGTLGTFGCYSFHETKNYSMGEGGALLVNDPSFTERAEIIREKGTNRTQFLMGQIDKYTWVDAGSSWLPSDMNAAYLYAQLEAADEIDADRQQTWAHYHEALAPLAQRGLLDVPAVPEECRHNAHLYYVKLADLDERTRFIDHLKAHGVQSAFHYIPLHSSPAGRRFGRFHGRDEYTTRESERLVRLPMYYGMGEENVSASVESVCSYFAKG